MRAPLAAVGTAAGLRFDTPVARMLRLRRTVNTSLAGLALLWAEPAKSCSASSSDEWIAFAEAQRLAFFSQLMRETEDLRWPRAA